MSLCEDKQCFALADNALSGNRRIPYAGVVATCCNFTLCFLRPFCFAPSRIAGSRSPLVAPRILCACVGCDQVPRLLHLPGRMHVDVAKCHACRTNSHGDTGAKRGPSAPLEPAQYHKRHVCHTECTLMSPSATPATQSEGRCRQAPRLPRKVKVDVAKRHACHTNSRGDNGAKRGPSAPPEPAQCQ